MVTSLRFAGSLALVLLCATTVAAQPWPAGGLAIRTNGSTFREGDCIRVALLAIEDVPGPLVPQVTYEFNQELTIKGADGVERTFPRRQVVGGAAGAMLERVDAGTSTVIDDTFCFGVGSTPGPYELTVSLTSGGSQVGSLTTCVEFHADKAGTASPSSPRCGFALRGVSRYDDPSVLKLEGEFPAVGLYRLAFLRGDRIVFLQEGGWVAVGTGELSFVVPILGPEGAGPVDLLLQDQAQSRSAVQAGVSLQR